MKFKDIIKNILVEGVKDNEIDWLINWFKKVPEEKLKKTFTSKDDNGKVITMSRDQILKLLSDKSNVMIVSDPGVKIVHDLDYQIGAYSPPGNREYPGKILISNDWKRLMKTSPTYKDAKDPVGTVIHHEKIHHLQYQQATKKTDYQSRLTANNKSKWSRKISSFCKLNTNTFCKKERAGDITQYLRSPEEIYAHLFTVREFLGIQPMDIITNVNANIKNNAVTISVSVSRDGKVTQLPTKNMNTENTSFKILYCCNNSFKETLMYLNNTLASIETPAQVDGDKIA
jgi:hypothetical protein